MQAKPRILLAIFGVFALVGGRIGIAEAQVVTGEGYTDQRAQLLAAGWKPDNSYGLKLAGGKPMHRFPEVLCGMEKCKAKWRDAKGAERFVWLNRGGPTEEYRVAPQ
jgi:hypothetical protein